MLFLGRIHLTGSKGSQEVHIPVLPFTVFSVLQPSLGNSSCASPEVKSLKQSEQKKTRKYEAEPDASFMEVSVDDDYDFIPGTPPHKKVKLRVIRD